MAKYDIPDDHEWADEHEPETEDGRPPIEVTGHAIHVDDNREVTGYKHGVEWSFYLEDGIIIGWYRGHYLDGRTQSDPMSSPPWIDVPAPVKRAVADALRTDVGSLTVDPPDFYGEEQ